MTPTPSSKGEMPGVAITSELAQKLREGGALLAVGVSGGKDSQACALAVADHAMRFAGPNTRLVLVHSDLGIIEWSQSLPVCERLAAHLGAELITVRRGAGGLMERFEQRWESSVRRYSSLETMKLVLPFSTPAMRFCTSELKAQVINAELRRRAVGLGLGRVINACGIRREESPARQRSSIAEHSESASTQRVEFWNWNPIIEWKIGHVFRSIDEAGLSLHPAYTQHAMTRVSCRFCIMSSAGDLAASAAVRENHDLLRRIVRLETASTFGFQGAKWLADVRPEILSASERDDVQRAKAAAQIREEAEATIPAGLLHIKAGWPQRAPTSSEADLIAAIRCRVADAVGISIEHRTGESVAARFDELLAKRDARSEAATPPAIVPLATRPNRSLVRI